MLGRWRQTVLKEKKELAEKMAQQLGELTALPEAPILLPAPLLLQPQGSTALVCAPLAPVPICTSTHKYII